ncbi:hypothetical protein G647_08999 [Cladophialophora carrionii CBS 160.54]|uniref:Transcription factor domain-containing protein n=1 Tax=Cladophialophora carrionii CBS 160.54 TaxID=1279043 RepID=V9CZA8_9EURO|nr:uncharacterized protein G647_08999 [Cladophialophora carrionii CBS 160.54]ETI19984.1 hypothetical protein G647_08999 [Cladophialophora carrionii CBS 160.54]
MSDEVMRALNNCRLSHLSSLARGFDGSTTTKLLGPQILCYVSWQRQFLMMKELANAGTWRKMTVEDYGISSSMVHRADYHLLTLPHLTQLSPVRNLVRLVLLIGDIAAFIGLPSGPLFVPRLSVQLKGALRAVNLCDLPNLGDEVVRLILWACFYGVELSIGLAEHPWFLLYLRQSQRILGLHQPAEVLALLVSFMYTEKQFFKISAIVWKDASGEESGRGREQRHTRSIHYDLQRLSLVHIVAGTS